MSCKFRDGDKAPAKLILLRAALTAVTVVTWTGLVAWMFGLGPWGTGIALCVALYMAPGTFEVADKLYADWRL